MRQDIRSILHYAVLAPSSHNTQPWQFHVDDMTIAVRPDFSRRLVAGDPDNRLLYISLGCATQNIIEAAGAFGYEASILEMNEEGSVLQLSKTNPPHNSEEILASIRHRVTNRNTYTNTQVCTDFIKSLEPQYGNISVHSIEEKDQKKEVARICIKASIAAMKNPAFRREMSHHVKSNTTRSRTGLPLYGFGVPNWLSHVIPPLTRYLNVNWFIQLRDYWLLTRKTPYILTLTAPTDDAPARIATGMLYERIALEAQRAGISTAAWASPVQVAPYTEKLQALLKTGQRPLFVFRLGVTKKQTKHSLRLPLSDVLQEA